MWGTHKHIDDLFGADAADIRCVRKHFKFCCRSPAHWIEVFRNFYGPTHKVFATLDAVQQGHLTGELTALLERFNTAGRDSLVVPSEYLEIVITKQ